MFRIPVAFTSLSHVFVIALLPMAFFVVKGFTSDSKVHTEVLNEVPVIENTTISIVTSGLAADVLNEIKPALEADFPSVTLYITNADSTEDLAALTTISDSTAYTTEAASTELEISYSPESVETVQPLIKWLTSEHGRAFLNDLNITRLNVTVRD